MLGSFLKKKKVVAVIQAQLKEAGAMPDFPSKDMLEHQLVAAYVAYVLEALLDAVSADKAALLDTEKEELFTMGYFMCDAITQQMDLPFEMAYMLLGGRLCHLVVDMSDSQGDSSADRFAATIAKFHQAGIEKSGIYARMGATFCRTVGAASIALVSGDAQRQAVAESALVSLAKVVFSRD